MSEALKIAGLGKCFRLHGSSTERLLDLFLPDSRKFSKEFWAVRGFDLAVARGETVGIIGSNGSGKSTLLQMLAGTLQPTEGSLRVDGRVAALLELGAGFNPELTGRENAELCAAIHGVTGAELPTVCQKIHEFADIGEFIDQPVKNYSSGMFVRLAFAVIAHVHADVMIVDEALSVGDAYFAQKCARFFQEFKRRGTIVFVSHDLGTVKQLCDRVVWLEKGTVRAVGDPKSVTDQYLKHLYARDQDVEALSPAAVGVAPDPSSELRPDFRLAQATPPGVWNRLEAFRFTADSAFGAGRMTIEDACFAAPGGSEALRSLHGGERLVLRIQAVAHEAVADPIFGFFVRNRAGTNLFGDNDFLRPGRKPGRLQPGQRVSAEFEFFMPSLPKGEYSVCVAVATGSIEEHEQQHWVNDAIMFNSIANHVHADFLGIPMLDMRLSLG
jgi:lipopolysaccharide transport system ATP-binding protein